MKHLKLWFKENRLLTVGLLLPLVLAIIFYIASIIPKAFVKPPQTDLLYLTTAYPHDGIITEVKEGVLHISITPAVRKGTLPMPHLFRFDAKTQTSTEIPLKLSTAIGITTPHKKEELTIPDIKDIRLDTQNTSPDGYTVEMTSPTVGGITNLLVLNTERMLTIRKNGYAVVVSENKNDKNRYQSIKFLGWIKKP